MQKVRQGYGCAKWCRVPVEMLLVGGCVNSENQRAGRKRAWPVCLHLNRGRNALDQLPKREVRGRWGSIPSLSRGIHRLEIV